MRKLNELQKKFEKCLTTKIERETVDKSVDSNAVKSSLFEVVNNKPSISTLDSVSVKLSETSMINVIPDDTKQVFISHLYLFRFIS